MKSTLLTFESALAASHAALASRRFPWRGVAFRRFTSNPRREPSMHPWRIARRNGVDEDEDEDEHRQRYRRWAR